jgi:hypothetical protein
MVLEDTIHTCVQPAQDIHNMKELKRHPDKIFITENLTQYRTNLVKALAELKYSRKIHAYWTTDGERICKSTNT